MREFLQAINDYPWTCFLLAMFLIAMAVLIFQRGCNDNEDNEDKSEKGGGYEGY